MNGNLYKDCRLCPRNCGVDRLSGKIGFCGETSEMRLAWAGLHRGEEPPVTGENGSGTLFFTGCTLRCAFCQNHQLSRSKSGRGVSSLELASIMLDLQAKGASNINVVTGTHFIPGILESLRIARGDGLMLPLVWNTSGFETLEMAKLLHPYVDLWLPDLKTLDTELASRLFRGADYPKAAGDLIDFILEKHAAGEGPSRIEWDDEPLKMIIRHLILPGKMDSTHRVLEYYAHRQCRGISFSLMTQYTPVPSAPEAAPNRILRGDEAAQAYNCLEELNIREGFFQGPPDGDDWLPDFNNNTPFPTGFAKKVWIWNEK